MKNRDSVQSPLNKQQQNDIQTKERKKGRTKEMNFLGNKKPHYYT
jgi:hypothetical protein